MRQKVLKVFCPLHLSLFVVCFTCVSFVYFVPRSLLFVAYCDLSNCCCGLNKRKHDSDTCGMVALAVTLIVQSVTVHRPSFDLGNFSFHCQRN